MTKMVTIILSGCIIYSKNQMVMVSNIILICACLASWMFMVSNIQWFSLLILLIYISGIMVLFMFIVSLSPNEKTQLKKKKNQAVLMASAFYMTKIFVESENSKISSSFEHVIMPITLIIIIILFMAYLPPKMVKSFYKGMKSTK